MKLTSAISRLELKNVLVATDLSPASEPALKLGRAIAQRYGSKLFVTNVISPAETALVPPEYWGASQQTLEEAAERQLQELGAKLHGLPHRMLLEHGIVSEAISGEIEKLGIDFLVVGTHGREGFDRLIMGSVAEKIFRRVTCPVLTVGPAVSTHATDVAEFKDIIFATNFGPESLAAAAYAISLAQESQARLTLVHIVSEPLGPHADKQVVILDRLNRLQRLIPSDATFWCKPDYVVEFGKATDLILNVARERNADLIVLGAKSANRHPGAATHLFSATAHTVVAHASCPVMMLGAQVKATATEREGRRYATVLPSPSYVGE